MSDNLSGIFDHLTPDMFISETSAIDEIEGKYVGEAAFNASVDERVRGVRAAFATSFGRINPLAILVSPDRQRVFTPQQDENLGNFLERLKREALTMGAHWFFFAKRHTIGLPADPDARQKDPEVFKGDETDMIGEVMPAIVWYAEFRDTLARKTHTRNGRMLISPDGMHITDTYEDERDRTAGVFSAILDVVVR